MAEKKDDVRTDPAKEKRPGTDNSPNRGGYSHADTRMGHEHSEMLGEVERAITGSKPPPADKDSKDADALSRARKKND